jgi:hypothetical protein
MAPMLASQLISGHFAINEETLVPTTEVSVWQSNCKSPDYIILNDILAEISKEDLLSVNPEVFSPLHVRVGIYYKYGSIYIDGNLIVKRINATQVRYFSVKGGSNLHNKLLAAFSTCERERELLPRQSGQLHERAKSCDRSAIPI